MIRRLSYVACDKCGDPAQPGFGAKEARGIARYEGFECDGKGDLCAECAGKKGYRSDTGKFVEEAV